MKTFPHKSEKTIRAAGYIALGFAICCALLLGTVHETAMAAFGDPGAASGKYTVLAPLPCIESQGVTCSGGNLNAATQVDFKSYVQYAVNLAIALSAVLAVFMFVWGGFEYITSTIPGVKSDGAKRIKNAVFGLILVLASYIILRTVDPRLVQIPTTLVPQLTINQNLLASSTSSLLNDLQTAANSLQTQHDNAKQNLVAAQNQLTTYQGDLAAINKQITDSYSGEYSDLDQICTNPSGDDTIQQLCASRANKVNQIKNAENAAVVSTVSSGMLESIQTANLIAQSNDPGINTAANVQTRIDYVNTLYNTSLQTMQQNSNPPDSAQKQSLDDMHNYALGMLAMQKDVIDGPSFWSSANAIISAGLKDITVTALGTALVPIPGAGGALGEYAGVSSYTDSKQQAMAGKFNTDVIQQYASQIKDPNLRNQLITNANNAVKSIGSK